MMEIKQTLIQIKNNFNGIFCYVHARAAVAPDGTGVLTSQPLRISGCDNFYGIETRITADYGNTWSDFVPDTELKRRRNRDNTESVFANATPFYHSNTGKFLLVGNITTYDFSREPKSPRPVFSCWSVFDSAKKKWSKIQLLKAPKSHEEDFFFCSACSTQFIELKTGEILLPVYIKNKKEADNKEKNIYSSTVIRCSFNGKDLRVIEIGNKLSMDIPRGLYEPSIACLGKYYFLTLRNDEAGYVSISEDGLNFAKPKTWLFDDGTPLGNYNTQQHWLNIGERLYLVYTRRGAGNDHIFRHRAPLFFAEIDTATCRVIRDTEKIAIPERGARLCNFGTCSINKNEGLIVAAEWMQTTDPDNTDWRKCVKYGSDNSIFIAHIHAQEK